MTKIRLPGALLLFLVMASMSMAAPAQATADRLQLARTANQYLAEHPGGMLVSDREVRYSDGSGFVASNPGTDSLSQCGSSKFCMWTAASYTGSFTYVTGTGVTITLTGTVKSFWNNRSYAARLYNNAGTSSTCYTAGTMKSSLATGYQSPAKVYLSSSTAC